VFDTMNQLSSLMAEKTGNKSTYDEVQEATYNNTHNGNGNGNGNDNSNSSETTPMISPGITTKQSTSILSTESSFTYSPNGNGNGNTNELMTGFKAIWYYINQNITSVIIVILLAIIFALTGEKASSRGEAANLIENGKSAKLIPWRPCQIYLDESPNGDNNSNNVQVLQTSLGDPSTHWGAIPCLVRNEHEIKIGKAKFGYDESQWNWLFGSDDITDKEPLEYGMPSAEIKVDFNTIAFPKREPIMGFGGAFTEASALNYMSLNEDGRDAVLDLLFGKNGLGYSLGRVHMNSCDFSVESYNFDDVDGDFNLTNFDTKVEHDVMSGMIEMMLQANSVLKKDWPSNHAKNGGGIKIMASPWSPPAWMKLPTYKDPPGSLHAVNMDGSAEPNCLREGTGPDSRYAATWALYFSKFLSAYKTWGVDLFAVTVQNEPEFPAPWEACAYDPTNQASFIANHLGPVLRRDHPDVKLLIFDHNKDHAVKWGKSILNQSNPASEFVDGTAVHWYAGGMDRLLDGSQGQPNLHRFLSMLDEEDVKPNHLLLGSEACHCPSTGYAGGNLKVAWDRAERYGHTVLADLAAGSNGWVEWNLILDSLGGPNHLGNMCDSPLLAVPYRANGEHNVTVLPSFEHSDFPFGPVVGDTRTREELNAMGFPAEYLDKGVVVQPMFYYMGHISRHVRPGSRAVHAIVDQTDFGGPSSRTFRQTINNKAIAGGGINNLARPGIEVTLWPCEGSTRQKWTLNVQNNFQVFGHDWLGAPTVSCIGHTADPSFKGLLLTSCDDESTGMFRVEYVNVTNATVHIFVENSNEIDGENCLISQPLKNNGGAYGARGGAQVNIGSCDSLPAIWKFDDSSGEIISSFFEADGGDVCVTTGWPFLQVGAFNGPEGQKNRTIVILNEASEPANYVLRNGNGEVFMTNSISSNAIQTVIL